MACQNFVLKMVGTILKAEKLAFCMVDSLLRLVFHNFKLKGTIAELALWKGNNFVAASASSISCDHHSTFFDDMFYNMIMSSQLIHQMLPPAKCEKRSPRLSTYIFMTYLITSAKIWIIGLSDFPIQM